MTVGVPVTSEQRVRGSGGDGSGERSLTWRSPAQSDATLANGFRGPEVSRPDENRPATRCPTGTGGRRAAFSTVIVAGGSGVGMAPPGRPAQGGTEWLRAPE